MESPYEEGLIWTGSDDGLLHISRDGGSSWQNVTPAGMPEWMMFNSIDPDPFNKGGAFVAGTRYKMGDFEPYLYHTKDYGNTWTKITAGIPDKHFTRVVRADPAKEGLLYAGSEYGMYISYNNGQSWQPFQLNLPIVPITDLHLKNDNLIVATQGRSLWILDDLAPVRMAQDVQLQQPMLYPPKEAYKMRGGQSANPRSAGMNHAAGALVHFYLPQKPDTATTVMLSFLTSAGDTVKSFSSDAKKKEEKLADLEAGVNSFAWDLRYPDAEDFDGMVMWWAGMTGPKVAPGTYTAVLKVNEQEQRQNFKVVAPPTSEATQADHDAQFTFLMNVRNKVTEAHTAIKNLRMAKEQLSAFESRMKDNEAYADLVDDAKELREKLTEVEKNLYQTQNRSGQDPLNYPIRLTNKLAHLTSLTAIGDFAPTAQAEAFRAEISAAIDVELEKLNSLVEEEIAAFNKKVNQQQVPLIYVEME
jgi:hypothetical protein